MKKRLVINFSLLLLSAIGYGQWRNFGSVITVIGDPAPKLAPEVTIRGRALEEIAKGKCSVVFFWASWSGPCIQEFEPLSLLADRYKRSVDFVGVNTHDRLNPNEMAAGDPGHVDRIRAFVEKNSASMRFRVALDDSLNSVNDRWLMAANFYTIPNCVVVNREGKICWIGAPDKLAPVLARVVQGKFDVAAAREAEVRAFEKERMTRELLRMSQHAVETKNVEGLKSLFQHPTADAPVQRRILLERAIFSPMPALTYLPDMLGAADKISAAVACNVVFTFANLAQHPPSGSSERKLTQADVDILVSCSETYAARLTPEEKTLGSYMHARTLALFGRRSEALIWFRKAGDGLGYIQDKDMRESQYFALKAAIAALK